MEEAPVEETPAETPEEEMPVEETPAEGKPAEGSPAEGKPAEGSPVVGKPVVVDTPGRVLPVVDQAAVKVGYENCTEVRNVLGRPILLGEEGFRAGLDRDNDGVGCELDTDGTLTDKGTDSTTGTRTVVVADDGETAERTGQLAYTGTDDSVKVAGGIGAGLLALGAGMVLAGRGRHRAVKA
ncbi:excalibur calcium-binding domain-containing protein [Arthrobacter pityocampae]|uniref:excalibur calcium-binding domain-containing protein n=1 Tax=Arthrobacter pityocampae TaxID=547334 RepID=UPI0037356D88